jgi:tyrosine-protein kinase Etk/Wzc
LLENSDISKAKEYRDRLTNFSNEFDLGLFIHICRKSFWWVFLCIALALAGAAIYLRYTPYTYESKAVIQLAEEQQPDELLGVAAPEHNNEPEAKVELLRSKLLISRTVNKMPLRVSYFAKGEILTAQHYLSSPYQVDVLELTNVLIQDKQIQIAFESQDQFTIAYDGKVFEHCVIGKEISTPDFKILVGISDWEELFQSDQEYDLYFVFNSTNSLVAQFYDHLNVRILNSTAKTIEISLKDNNPYLARDFVRAHSTEFILFDLEKRRKSDDNVLSFLDEQIDTVYANLKRTEVQLNSYKQINKINDLDGTSQMYLGRLSEYDSEILQTQMEERLLNDVEVLTKKSSNDVEIYNLIPLVAGSKYEGALSGLLSKLHDQMLALDETLLSHTTDHERVKTLRKQIDIQKRVILQTIEALRDQITSRKRALDGKLAQLEGEYYAIPQKELEFARLQRLSAINEKYYTLLLEKSIEYKISKEGFVSNNQILDEAKTPAMPISPKKNLVLLTFVLFGVVLSFIIVTLRYLMHNEISTLNEIIKHSNGRMHSLGIIPKYKEEVPVSMLLVDQNPRSLMAESFRSVRTNLQFLNAERSKTSIAVTSTISGEGKTFVSLNLAGIIAFGEKKVIVCDLDMRKPKIHKGFNAPNDKGMSTLLIGKHSMDECIQKSTLANLDYITAGPVPPNPSELIISKRMDAIMEQLLERYDYVIFDTPPVGLVTDGVSLLKKVDIPVYVFRAEYSQKPFIQVADKLINENLINLNVILNGVDLDRNRYTYRYSYGYGYGYGHGSAGYYDETSTRKKGKRNKHS